MWIVIEGPTCSGKSTLYDEINRQLTRGGTELETVHMDRPQELNRRWVLNDYVNRWQTKPDHDVSILADRWHFGEYTYAPIYRPKTNKDGYGLLGRAGWRWTELFLMSRGAVIAQTTAPIDVLITRLAERGDDHVRNDDELRQVAGYYTDAISLSPNTAIVFDTSDEPDPAEMAARVIRVAEAAAAHVAELSRWQGYIGPRNPAVLLLGDERNITKRYGEETILPFMPVDGNSGEYLLDALPEPDWRLVGIVNAGEVDDLHGLWVTLGRPPVSALGNSAALTARKADVPAVSFNHPQYMRRFRNSEKQEYGEYICMETIRSMA